MTAHRFHHDDPDDAGDRFLDDVDDHASGVDVGDAARGRIIGRIDPDDDGCEIDGRSGFCHRDHECPEPDLDGEDLFPARPVSHRDAITDGCLEATRD